MLSDEEFARLYPTTRNAEVARVMEQSVSAVTRRAKRLGLQKDHAWLASIASATHRGKVWSEESRARVSASLRASSKLKRGPENPNWKGGVTRNRFKNPRYDAFRREVLERDGYVCFVCGRQCHKREKGLAVHHVQSWAEHPELRYEASNGRTICRACHMDLHGLSDVAPTIIVCACGCGQTLEDRDRWGQVRRFLRGHASRAQSAETRAKISQSGRGRRLNERQRDALAQARRQPKSDEHRAKLAAAHTGRPLSVEHRAKLSAAGRGRPGRSMKGENNPRAQLTEEAVRAMRQAYAQGESHTSLAQRYGIAVKNAYGICRGKTWKHLPLSDEHGDRGLAVTF